jgi:hypothetical protein
MEEENNCFIIKYRAEIKEKNDEEKRCFVLDEFYSKKFKTSPENNCIIIKYRAEIKNYEEKRCFVLDEFYSKKFKKSPINELKVSYPISNGYDCEYTVAELYFIEAISRHTHNEIKRLFLADNEKEDIIDILNNRDLKCKKVYN